MSNDFPGFSLMPDGQDIRGIFVILAVLIFFICLCLNAQLVLPFFTAWLLTREGDLPSLRKFVEGD